MISQPMTIEWTHERLDRLVDILPDGPASQAYVKKCAKNLRAAPTDDGAREMFLAALGALPEGERIGLARQIGLT